MTILEFAKKITDKSVEAKMEAYKQIERCVLLNKAPDGSDMTDEQRIDLGKLLRWLNLNMIVGEELCPAETVGNY